MSTTNIIETIKEIHALKGQHTNGSELDDDRDKAIYSWFAKNQYTASRADLLAMTAYAAKEGYSEELVRPRESQAPEHFWESERRAIFDAINIGRYGNGKEIWNLQAVASYLNMPLEEAEKRELPKPDFILPNGEHLWQPLNILIWIEQAK